MKSVVPEEPGGPDNLGVMKADTPGPGPACAHQQLKEHDVVLLAS